MDFQQFKEKYQCEYVEEFPNKVDRSPVISVCVQTYQHAKYIEKCLQGILMQRTQFPFEVLIGDDDSIDGTREICVEYARKYPDKIRMFLHRRENNIRINDRATGRFNILYNLYRARGKYVALCEGDDYWTDPLKLQKQFVFFRNNNECSIVFHGCERTSRSRREVVRFSGKKIMDLNDYLISTPFAATASLMFKREILNHYQMWMVKLFAADFVLRYLAFLEGNMGYIDEVMCVYNKGIEGSWSDQSFTKKVILKEYRDSITVLHHVASLSTANIQQGLTSRRKRVQYRNYMRLAHSASFLGGCCFLLKRFKVTGMTGLGRYLINGGRLV